MINKVISEDILCSECRKLSLGEYICENCRVSVLGNIDRKVEKITKTDSKKILTQEQVDALPTGTKVCIVWSGGNGPFEYQIGRRFGVTFAYVINTSDGTKTLVGFLDHVGTYPRTQVWLADKQPTNEVKS